jgi:TetR/AcrR family transcriptional regulator of autoinduction and epiphytic fitness
MRLDEPGRRARKRLKTLSHLAAVARTLFDRDGYEPVTMEQIAAEADVAKGTLYNHFPTKEAVLAYAIHHQLAQNLEELGDQRKAECGFKEGVGALMDSLSNWCETHREYLAPYLRFRFSDLQAPTPDAGVDGPNDIVDVYAFLVANSQHSGELRKDLEARQLAVMFHHMTLGALLEWLLNPSMNLRHELAVAVELFLNGAQRERT